MEAVERMGESAVGSATNRTAGFSWDESFQAFAADAAKERGRLLSMARRSLPPEEAEDIVQEVLLAALEQRDRFEGRSRMSTWLVAILLRKVVDRHRRMGRDRRRASADTALDRVEAGAQFDAEHHAIVEESLVSAQRAIEGLTDRERTVIEALATLERPGEVFIYIV
jgi:RNA polymerase sigma factor (sigma-70 family)